MNNGFNNNTPIYIQVLDYIKTYIISGKFKPGEKLPSVREFSSLFKVNPNTMQKALEKLENDKLIYTERTNGKYVTTDLKKIEKIKNDYAKSIADDYLKQMDRIGIKKKIAIDYLKEGNDK